MLWWGGKRRRRRHEVERQSSEPRSAYVRRVSPKTFNGVALPEKPCGRIDWVYDLHDDLVEVLFPIAGGGSFEVKFVSMANKGEYLGTTRVTIAGDPMIDGRPIPPKEARVPKKKAPTPAKESTGSRPPTAPVLSAACRRERNLVVRKVTWIEKEVNRLKDTDSILHYYGELKSILKAASRTRNARSIGIVSRRADRLDGLVRRALRRDGIRVPSWSLYPGWIALNARVNALCHKAGHEKRRCRKPAPGRDRQRPH